MALRVLLADESSTIKRAIEISLQDFAVEVKSVHLGPDVVPVIKTFKPDIVFADVLLQKLSGYEVCEQIKKDPTLTSLPVVLLWSGFMELDQAKFIKCRASAKLEKPFSTEGIREVVQGLVAKTKSQKLSSFMTFPALELEDPEKPPTMIATPVVDADENPTPTKGSEPLKWDWNQFESIDEFQQKNLQTTSKPKPTPAEEPWEKKDLSAFRAPLPKNDEDELVNLLDDTQLDSSITKTPMADPLTAEKVKIEWPHEALKKPTTPATTTSPLHENDMEHMIQEQAKEMIEAAVWKVVPEIAERIIREEIQRLLQNKDKELGLD